MSRYFVDVREPHEFKKGHIEGALNIPPDEIIAGASQLKDVDKQKDEIILYCVSGARANASINFLKQQGFKNLTNGINKEHVSQKYGKNLT
jgi:phage shock protein E